MLERRAHRVRVRVVRVVHDETATRQRELLSAPGREPNSGDALVRSLEWEAERVVGVQRGERVQREVALREGELELDLAVADAEAA